MVDRQARLVMRVALLVLVITAAGGIGYALGQQNSDDNDPISSADCPIVQVPVSDHIEPLCMPEAAPLFELFDEQSTPPGPAAEGWTLIGELWLSQGNDFEGIEGQGVCWVNATEETKCSS